MKQEQVDALDNQLRALELRKAGVPYAKIAEALGYKSASGAHKAVESALKKTLQEPSDQLRNLEIERLDAALMAVWPSVTKGQYGAIDRFLRIQERRAKLLGLDAPTKQDITSGGEKIINESDIKDSNARFARTITTLADALRETISGTSGKQNSEVDTPK